MIFVTMRDDIRLYISECPNMVKKTRYNTINAKHVGFSKQYTGIDQNRVVSIGIERTIHSKFAAATQRQDNGFFGVNFGYNFEILFIVYVVIRHFFTLT